MLALMIIGVILLLLLLIACIRVGVLVEWGETLILSLAVGPFKIQLVPGKKEAEKNKKPKEEKIKKEKKKPEEAGEKAKKKIAFGEIKEMLAILWPALVKTLRRIGRGIRVAPLSVELIIGGDDPTAVAETYGWVNNAVWMGMPILEKWMDIPGPHIHTGFDFDAPKTVCRGKAGITMRIGTGVGVVFGLLGPLVRVYLRKDPAKKELEENTAKERK